VPHRIALGLLSVFVSIAVLPIAAQQMTPRALIVRPEDRPPVAGATASCGSIRYLVDSEHTGGAFSMVESNECGKPMTNVHRHHSMDEAFYVVEGTLTIYVDDKFHVLEPGSYFFVPRGTPHAQGNPCKVPNKVLVTFTPGGFERFLKDRGEVAKTHPFGTPEYRAALEKWRGVFGAGVAPPPVPPAPCPPGT
jgi:quercetin dioxygenase-like cupin family protein